MRSQFKSFAITSIILILAFCGCSFAEDVANPRPVIHSVSPQPIVASSHAQVLTIEGTGFTEKSKLTLRYRLAGHPDLVFADQPVSSIIDNTITVVATFELYQGIWTAEITNGDYKSGEFFFQVVISDKEDSAKRSTDADGLSSSYVAYDPRLPFVVDDYPAPYRPPTQKDTINTYGFHSNNRECTSFVAWRLNRDHGTPHGPPYENYFFTDNMNRGSYTWGNAGHWADAALHFGFQYDQVPRVGSIAQWNNTEIGGGYGHVAYVEQIDSNGTVWVSDYNHSIYLDGNYRFHQATAPRYIHINDPEGSDFAVSASPLSETITRGQPAQFMLTVTSQNGYDGPVLLYALNLPPGYGSGTTWNPLEITPRPGAPASSVLTIYTNALTSTGTFPITLRANNGDGRFDTSRDMTVNLTINPSGGSFHVQVSPTTGLVNSTMYRVNGMGVTPYGTVKSNSFYPDGTEYHFTKQADGAGNFYFGPFTLYLVGTYTETYVDVSRGTVSNQLTYYATANPSASVSPTSGVANMTWFTVSGLGATRLGGGTAKSTWPDQSVHYFTVTADGRGNFQFGPFQAHEVGTYSEVYTDNSSGVVSGSLTYHASANPSASVNPTNGVVNQTWFTVTGIGATGYGTVTAKSTWPDQSVHYFTVTADGRGNFQFGPFQAHEVGTYSEVYVDNSSGAVSGPVAYVVRAY
jgi:surface antigen